MRAEASVEIDRPIDEVFHYTNDHVIEWSETCVSEELIEEHPDVVGSTFRMTTADRGREMVFEGVVTRYEEPRLSAVHLAGSTFDLDVAYTFEDLGGRTRVTQQSNVIGKGVTKVFLFVLGPLMRRTHCDAQGRELASLKSHCEARGQTG